MRSKFNLFMRSNFREKVTTTNFTTSKTKKNIEKFANHHYIESLHLSDQNIESDKDQNIENTKITTSKVVDHYYENHNVENNIESHNWLKNHFRRCDHSQRHR
jgi:hypothetical protein